MLISSLILSCCILAVKIPSTINLGYANWRQCDWQLTQAVKNGVNVLVWFSIQLDYNGVSGGPDISCVQNIGSKLPPEVVQLIAIGGWNVPHPHKDRSGEFYYNSFNNWNKNTVAKNGYRGFDGIDWDFEGNDDANSPYNTFTYHTLDVMGVMSQLAKRDGYIVALVPAETYLTPETPSFDLSLQHSLPAYSWFKYHGKNAYAYVIDKYGIDIFDWVMVQFYERYSNALYNIIDQKKAASSYLASIVKKYVEGYFVNFPDGYRKITIPKEKLVLGIANGWATNSNGFLRISIEELGKLWSAVQFRGFGWWSISEEGKDGYNLAAPLAAIMKTPSGPPQTIPPPSILPIPYQPDPNYLGGYRWGAQIFAPVVDLSANANFDLSKYSGNVGSARYILGYISANANNAASWGGKSPYTGYASQILAIRNFGGDAIISFGGIGLTELATTTTSSRTLMNLYQNVIDAFSSTWIDFSLDSVMCNNQASVKLRNQVLRQMQSLNPNLKISYTLPVTPQGLKPESIFVLSNALELGVRVDGNFSFILVVNVMAFNFGSGNAPNAGVSSSPYAIQAATFVYSAIQTMGLKSKIGITVVIGSANGEVFSLADANALTKWAKTSKWVQVLSFMSANRDVSTYSYGKAFVQFEN